MKKIIVSFLVMCIPALIFAQLPGQIKGKILDAKTKEILPGATIFVDYMGDKIATFAEKDGNFTLKPLNPGTYIVYVKLMGYDTSVFENVVVNSDKTTYLDEINLSAGITIKKPVDIVSMRPIDKGAGQIKVIDNKIISALPDRKNVSSILRTMFSDIYVSDDGKDIYFRGSRSGDAVYFVDGVKMRDNQLHIPGSAIGNMAVYTGGVPANYGDFTGGVVVIETQSYFSWLNERKAKRSSAMTY